MQQTNNTSARSASNNESLSEDCPQNQVLKKSNTFNFYTINETEIKHKILPELPYNKSLREYAKALRYAENLPEVLFWMQITKKHFHKIDFDRQRIIGNYIVDFYIKKLGLVIEIDGKNHDDKEEYDKLRESYLT